MTASTKELQIEGKPSRLTNRSVKRDWKKEPSVELVGNLVERVRFGDQQMSSIVGVIRKPRLVDWKDRTYRIV